MPATTDLLNMARSTVGARGSAQRKVVGGVVLGGLFLAGLGKTLGRGMTDAAMDVAFGDPNADQKLLGTKLTPSLLIGGTMGGQANPATVGAASVVGAGLGAFAGRRFGRAGMAVGGAIGGLTGTFAGQAISGGIGPIARTMNPMQFPISPGGSAVGASAAATPIAAAGGMVAGAATMAAIAAKKGYFMGKAGSQGIKRAVSVGGAAGGIVAGGIASMAAIGGIVQAKNVAKANSQILDESPFYNTSLMTAERLNARGDIVLGAHNTRRGGY